MKNKPSAARNVGLANRSSEQAGVAPFAKGYGGTLRARSRAKVGRVEREMLPGRLGLAQASAPKARCRTARVGPANRPSAARISQGKPGRGAAQQTDRSERGYQRKA